MIQLDAGAIDRILKHIASKGFDVQKEIQPELFGHTLSTLNKVVDSVFGSVKYGDDDFDFANLLKTNNAVFSAFKTHKQQNEIHAHLLDDKGKVRSFAEFRKATQPILHNYNSSWFQTEYNTAIIRAQFAQKFRQIERNKDIYPGFQWLPSTSVTPRSEHKLLYYKVFAIDDPILINNYPGSLWGCKCGGRSTNLPITEKSEAASAIKSTPKPDKGLDNNPGISAELFTKSHPYIANCSKGMQKILALESQKMMSDISRREVRSFFKEQLKKPYILNPSSGPINQILLSYQDIKNITGKPHKFNYQKNQCCYFLPEIFKEAKYVGCSPDIKGAIAKGHADVLRWHYYSFNLNNEKSYLTIKESLKGEYKLHSIQDVDHFSLTKIKEKPQ